MRKRIVFNFSIIAVFVFGLSTCASFTKTKTLEEIKSSLNCVTYQEGMKWQVVQEKFGKPDFTPIPTAEKLSQNTRIYKDKTIIFYTEIRKTIVHEKPRYEEVITMLEICETK
jgi:hypothetical protein